MQIGISATPLLLLARHQLALREGYHSAQLSCLKHHCVCGSRADNIAHIPLPSCLWFQHQGLWFPTSSQDRRSPPQSIPRGIGPFYQTANIFFLVPPKPQRAGGFWCNFSRQNAGGRGKELDVDHSEEMANPLSLIYLLFSIISRNPISHFLPDRSRAVSFVLRHSDFHVKNSTLKKLNDAVVRNVRLSIGAINGAAGYEGGERLSDRLTNRAGTSRFTESEDSTEDCFKHEAQSE